MRDFKSIKTTYSELDKITGGFFSGEVTIIGARPSVGKSAFLFSLIKRITFELGTTGLFFSVEMSAVQVHLRLVSSMAAIPFSKIRDSELDKDEIVLIEQLSKQVKDFPLVINDEPNLNIRDLCEKARELHKKKEIKIIYIDYLGLITTDDENQPVYERVSFVIRKLKILARELNIPIVIACQLARTANGQIPRLQELRGSGAIESISDVVLLLDRDNSITNDFSPSQVIVAKNHNGALGTVNLMFVSRTMSFEEPSIPV